LAVNERLREEGEVKKTLVICPNYLKWKWADELSRYTDSSYVVLDGSRNKRTSQTDSFVEDYLIVNYELLLQDYVQLMHIGFDVIIADEVTRIKNYQSKTKKVLKKLRPEYRWGLTGTPVANRPDELYSIVDWIDEHFFEKWFYFDKRYIVRNYFGGVDRYVNLKELAERTSKVMISMTQEEVGSELPEVITETIPLEFTKKQAKLYDEVAASLEEYLDVMVNKLLEDRDTDYETAKIRERFNALRMACVCPMIFEHSMSNYIRHSTFNYHDEGAKLAAIYELIEEKIQGTRDKMIIFSFYRGVIPLITGYL
jgi:SNF2 family DNA or RNA helicase